MLQDSDISDCHVLSCREHNGKFRTLAGIGHTEFYRHLRKAIGVEYPEGRSLRRFRLTLKAAVLLSGRRNIFLQIFSQVLIAGINIGTHDAARHKYTVSI